MRCWHYNIVPIIRCKEFQKALSYTLVRLEPDRKPEIIISMLCNYFNLRNRDFGSNWIELPSRVAVLHVNKYGIYYRESLNPRRDLGELNSVLKESIPVDKWVITFSRKRASHV